MRLHRAADWMVGRFLLVALAVGVVGGPLGSCSRSGADPNSVVLYTSADDVIARPLMELFEKQTGIKVLIKGDTEATKTTGLVERLRAEHASGRVRADVFWSSEPFLTCQLAREGVLAAAPAEVGKDWSRVGTGRMWFEFAERARVVVERKGIKRATEGFDCCNCGLFPARDTLPIVMARPQFGTTRGFLAALFFSCGEHAFRTQIGYWKLVGLQLVDGNSAVVRAVSEREGVLGLTDTDDVWSAQEEGLDVQACYPIDSVHVLMMANTVAMVAGRSHPDNAARLVEFLLSEESERFLMDSVSHNIPVRPVLLEEFQRKYPDKLPPKPWRPDIEKVTDAMPRAMQIVEEELLR